MEDYIMGKIIYNQIKKNIKKSTFILILITLIVALLTVIVLGADFSEMIKVYRNYVILEVDNTRISTDNFLYDGTTYAPVRVLSQILGKQVNWDPVTKVANITDLSYQETKTQTNMDLTLYFPDSNAEKVLPTVRNVPVYNDETARAAMHALISGPITAELHRSIPVETILLSIDILNGICTVNLSKEFVDNHWGGSAGEGLTLASIVNTLTEFPTIQKVMILVEGKAGATLGNILLDHALERMTSMIGQ